MADTNFKISKSYIKQSSRILSGMFQLIPTKVFYYDGASITEPAEKILLETEDITSTQTLELLKNNIIAFSEVNYLGSGDSYSEITLLLEGSKKTLDSNFREIELPGRENNVLRFNTAVVLFDIYETVAPNTQKIIKFNDLPLGILRLGKSVELDIENSEGLYGGSTSWSSKIYLGNSLKNNKNKNKKSGKNGQNNKVTINFEDNDAYSALIRKMNSLLEQYSNLTTSYNAYTEYIKDISNKFTNEKNVNVPYTKDGHWYVNGKLVGNFNNQLVHKYELDLELVYKEFQDRFNVLKDKTETQIKEIYKALGLGDADNPAELITTRLERIENSIINNHNTYLKFLKEEYNIFKKNTVTSFEDLNNKLKQLSDNIQHLGSTVLENIKKEIKDAYTLLINSKVNDINVTIEDLKSKLDGKADKIGLQEHLNKVNEIIENFKKSTPTTENMATLKDKVDSMIAQFNTLKNSVNENKNSITDVKSDLTTTKSSVNSLENKLKELEKKLTNLSSKNNIPIGMIALWSGAESTIPTGWERVNELSGRFPLGIGSHTDNSGYSNVINEGESGGEYKHKLSEQEMPSHTHDLSIVNMVIADGSNGTTARAVAINGGPENGNGNWFVTNTGFPILQTGNNKPHNNIPPYYAVYFIRYVG